MNEAFKEQMAVFLGAIIAIALLANMVFGVYILTVLVTGKC